MHRVWLLTVARLCILCLTALCALSVLRPYKPEWAPFLRLSASVVLLGAVLSLAAGVLSDMTTLLEDALPADTQSVLLRALGLAFATELCAGICRDSGETTLATWVETAGRLEILVLALPLIRTVADTVAGVLNAG